MDPLPQTSPSPQPSMPPAHLPGNDMGFLMIIIVTLVAIIAGIYGYFYALPAYQSATRNKEAIVLEPPPPATQATSADSDTTTSIDQDLKASSDAGNIDQEFHVVDQDAQNL